MHYKILESIDISPFIKEYHTIENQINWLNFPQDSGKQCGIQYKDGEDYFLSSTGRKKITTETEYSLTNPLFQNTIFEDTIKKYKLVRARLMWMGGRSCYIMHKDGAPRLHIPLVTTPNSMFIFPDESKLIHLPVGNVYAVNTLLLHSFCNFSDRPRLHFVGSISLEDYISM